MAVLRLVSGFGSGLAFILLLVSVVLSVAGSDVQKDTTIVQDKRAVVVVTATTTDEGPEAEMEEEVEAVDVPETAQLVDRTVASSAGERNAKDFGNDQWKAVQRVPEFPNAWVANPIPVTASPVTEITTAPQSVHQLVTQKRRRLRKRKRRPQPPVYSITEDESEDLDDRLNARRRQQQHTQSATEKVFSTRPSVKHHLPDDRPDTWKEMEEEGVRKPYGNRRRTGPVYQAADSGGSHQEAGTVSASIKFGLADPGPPANMEVRNKSMSVPNLKALLKQNGGLSLSEILQKRNLSLADLLRGQQDAIKALTDRPADIKLSPISEYKNPMEEDNRPVVKVPEHSTVRSVNEHSKEAQRKRLSGLYSKDSVKLYGDIKHFDVVTEATTEKRIFVPSHPKYYTSIDFRPEFEEISEKIPTKSNSVTTTTSKDDIETTTMIISTTPMTTTIPAVKSSRPRLPMTSASLNKKVRLPTTKTYHPTIPEKAEKIDFLDIFGLTKSKSQSTANKTDQGPLKMTIDLDTFVQTTERIELKSIQTNLIPDDSSTTWSSQEIDETTTLLAQEKLKNVSAKDEIMEVLRDEKTKEQLERLLDERNMTIDQLVEQRERGSSQRHLADIFHNKTREPEPAAVVHGGPYQAPERGLPYLRHLKPKPEIVSTTTEIIRTSTTKVPPVVVTTIITPSLIDIRTIASSSESTTATTKFKATSVEYGVTSFPSYKIVTDGAGKEPNLVPVWKTKSVYPTMKSHQFPLGTIEALDEANDLFLKEMQQIDEIENTIAKAVNDEDERVIKNQYGNSDKDDDYFNIPNGVKSAIIASLAIIGISLIVFLTILVIFRWLQRHKKRLCYGDTFSSKIKSPILDVNPNTRRSIRTIVHETLGRKSNPYKAQLQSMSDSWDSDSCNKSFK